MIENKDLIVDLIKSVRGRIHSLKGRGNSEKIISFAENELPLLKDFIYDALSHHLSGYNHHLKNGDEELADKHMRYFHQYMDLAERLANERPDQISIETPADIQHWEQNAKLNKDGTPNKTALHGWRLNQSDYSHVRKAPHPKFTQRIQEHGHTGAYPFERIKINGKYLDIDPDFDPTPSKLSPHNKETSINHHGMDYHPLMTPYIINKRSVPYFALSVNDRQKIAEGIEKDRFGNLLQQPDPDIHYSNIEEKFINKILPKMSQYKEQLDNYFKEEGKERGAAPAEPVHGHLKVKHLNIKATHAHLGQKDVSSGKNYTHVMYDRAAKEIVLSPEFLKKAVVNKVMLASLYALIETQGGPDKVTIKNAETGEKIKDIEEWYKNTQKENVQEKSNEQEEKVEQPKEQEIKEIQEPQHKPKEEQPKEQPEVKPEPKVEHHEVKPEPQPEPKTEQVEVKPEVKPEPKIEQPEVKPEVKPEPKIKQPEQKQVKPQEIQEVQQNIPKKPSFYSKIKDKLNFLFKHQKDGE